jgi:phage replication O-like protein O
MTGKESGSEIQLENGNYSQIHNRILELLTLRNDLTARELRCLLFLLRTTYGWKKTEDAISLTQWERGTGIRKGHVAKTLKNLEDRNFIRVTRNGVGRTKTTVYGFNKYYEQWTEKVPTGGTIIKVPTGGTNSEKKVPTGVTEKVPTGVPTKERKKVVAAATENRGSFIAAYEHIWGMVIESSMKAEMIHDWQDRITLAMWEYGLTESMKANARNWKYLESILRRVEVEGLPMNGAVKEYAPQTITIIDPVTKQPKEVTV